MVSSEAKKAADAKYDQKRAGKRCRTWWGVWYPEDENQNPVTDQEQEKALVNDLAKRMRDDLATGFISPLHNKDLLPDGTPKKAHRHVMWSYPSPVTRERAAQDAETWGIVVQAHWPKPGEPDSFKLRDWRQGARYLCHLDQPDKFRYETAEVISIGSATYQDVALVAGDEDEIVGQIFELMDANKLDSYAKVCRLVRGSHPEWAGIVYRKYSRAISEYAKSIHYEQTEAARSAATQAEARRSISIRDEKIRQQEEEIRQQEDRMQRLEKLAEKLLEFEQEEQKKQKD